MTPPNEQQRGAATWSGDFLVADWEWASFQAPIFPGAQCRIAMPRTPIPQPPSPNLCSHQTPASIIPASMAPNKPRPFIHS